MIISVMISARQAWHARAARGDKNIKNKTFVFRTLLEWPGFSSVALTVLQKYEILLPKTSVMDQMMEILSFGLIWPNSYDVVTFWSTCSREQVLKSDDVIGVGPG